MSEQTGKIQSYTFKSKTLLDQLLNLGGWLVSFISLIIIVLITYWAIKIPEKNINNLPIINAINGDIRVEPDNEGGKPFYNKDLTIYDELDSQPSILKKSEIIIQKSQTEYANLDKDIVSSKQNRSEQEDLNTAIENAVRKVTNNIPKSTGIDKNTSLKLYLGSFETLAQANEFKEILKSKNDELLKDKDIKIFEKNNGIDKVYRLQLVNVGTRTQGEKVCSILSRRQFSCLIFDE